MEARLNRLAGSEPCIRIRDELRLKNTQSPERRSEPSDISTENTSTLTCQNNIIEENPSGEAQYNEELLKQTLLVYSTLQSCEDTAQVSLGGPSEHQTMFSTMRVVPLDMEKLKEDLSYYQYKLYQRFAIKLTDLVKLETLGKGAFGEVTRVFNKTDRQFYALKEIRRRSFKKPIYFESAVWIEIQNLLKVTELKDPSLLKTALIDFDENEEICYLLMELGGGTLEEYADCMRHYGLTWSENELEYILYQLVSQILKLKRINMYHRDIKPSNIIISPKEEAFKLSDLGCAIITTEGVQKLDIAGTPHYMSPELIRAIMRQEPVVEHDPYLSDLFSLGITMLMLLNPELKRKDIVNFMESTVKEKYPNLYSILRDLLGRPEKRIEGVEKVLATRLSILNYKAFEEGNLGEKYKLYLYLKIISKNKNIHTSFYFDMFILDDALLVINKKLDILTKDMKQEDQNLEEVIWRIKRAQCYYMQMNYEDALKELLEVIQRKELKSFETPNILTKAKALLWLGIVKLKLGRIEDAIDHLMHCLGIRVAEFGEVHESVSAVFWQLGNIKNLQENFAGATKAFLKSIEIGEKLDPKERKYMAKSLNNLGVMAEFRGDHQKALELFERAKETAIEAYGENHPAVADQYLAISYVYIILGRKQEGLDLYDKALGIKKRWYGENNPEVAQAYTHAARGYDRLGEYKKVLELLSKSVTIWKNVDGEDSQELADVYQLIGNVLCKKGQYLKSLAYANKVIYIKEKRLGVGSPWLAATYIWHAETCSGLWLEDEKQRSLQKFLAIDFDKLELNIDNIKLGFRAVRLLAEEKKIEKAWEYVQKGYQMCVNLAIAKNAKTYACYCEAVGRLRKAEGKYDMALESIKEAINIREHLASKDPDMLAGLFSVMGDLYEALDNDEEALEWRKKCLNMIEMYLSKGSVLMLKALVDIYRVLLKLRMDEEAQKRLKEAKLLMEKAGIPRNHPITRKCIELAEDLEGRQGAELLMQRNLSNRF